MDVDLNNIIKNKNDNSEKLFLMIKQEKWKELLKYVEKNKHKNFDYYDENNILFLEYLVIYNKYEIVKVLLKNNCVTTINSFIMHIIVKYSYQKMLDLFIEKNSNSFFGYDILDFTNENGNSPIFEALQQNNMSMIETLLQHSRNIYAFNINGETILQQVILNKKYDLFLLVLKYFKNVNIQNVNGETPLHTIIKCNFIEGLQYLIKNYELNFNITEFKNNYSVLHYISFSNNIKIIDIIKTKLNDINPNIQDNSGNTYLHYFIKFITKLSEYNNDIYKVFKIYKSMQNNFNIQNIDGDCPAHIIFNDTTKNLCNEIYFEIIKNTNLNTQNKFGYSILFLLVKYNYFEKYIKILDGKKMNIFIFNNKKKIIFDFIKNENINNFIENVAINYLKNIDKNITYYDYWDNKCRYKKNGFTENEKKELISMGVNLNSKNIWYEIIYFKLKKNVDTFIKTRIVSPEMFSYPKTHIYPELIIGYENVNVSTYTSSLINIFFGLLYISKTFNYISSALNVIDKNNIIFKINNFCDMKNFQLLWKNFQLINPFENIINDIKKCIDEKYNYFIMTIGIELKINGVIHGHSNILIFDFINNEYERFEPYGQEPYFFKYDTLLLDDSLKKLFQPLNFKYITSSEFMPKIGIQTYETNETGIYIGDPEGYCSAWCLFWTVLRIKYSKIPREKLFNILVKEIINKGISYKSLIRFFCKNITDLRDKFFNNINININDWTNDLLNKEQIEKLNKILMIELQNY